MKDSAENSKSENSADDLANTQAPQANSKDKAPAAEDKPAQANGGSSKSADVSEPTPSSEKGQRISLRVVRQATQSVKPEEQEPAYDEQARSARAWTMPNGASSVAPKADDPPEPSKVERRPPNTKPPAESGQESAVACGQDSAVAPPQTKPAPSEPVQPSTSASTPPKAAPKVRPKAPVPQMAMPIVSRDDAPGTDSISVDTPSINSNDEAPVRTSASPAASRQLEAAMGTARENRETLPHESRSERLEALAEGLRWSPPRIPVANIIGFVALTLGAMLIGFLLCCSVTNVRIDFSDNTPDDGTHNRLIISPPMLRFVPKNSVGQSTTVVQETAPGKISTTKPEQEPTTVAPDSKRTESVSVAPVSQKPDTSTSQQPGASALPSQPEGASDSKPTDNEQAPDNQPVAQEAQQQQQQQQQPPQQQPQPQKQSTAQGVRWAAPANSQHSRQAYQMNSASSDLARPRHAYEMRPVPPAVVRHAYRTSDKGRSR